MIMLNGAAVEELFVHKEKSDQILQEVKSVTDTRTNGDDGRLNAV